MAPDPYILYAKIRQHINGLAQLSGRIWDGYVPEKIPTDASGFILPYVVLFAGAGTDLPAERDLSALVDTEALDWRIQTTVAAADALICVQVAHYVRLALTNLPVGTAWLMPDDTAITQPVPLLDPSVSPSRFFLPLPWRLITT